MLIHSINWLIDSEKALTSRQPQSGTWQPSWPGACVDVSVCLAPAVEVEEEEEEEEEVEEEGIVAGWTRLIDNTVI